MHHFARAKGLDNPQTMVVDYETRSALKTSATTLSDLEQDPGTRDILNQLRHHLESMQNNVEGIKGISAALTTSQAALDVFNWRKLGKAEYRQVYGVDTT